MAEPCRILLVDDNVPLRSGVRMLLRGEASFVVVGQAGDGEAAVRMAGELSPDVVLMDVHMPLLDGIEAIRRIRQAAGGRQTPVEIALSGSSDDLDLMRNAGTAGMIPKDRADEPIASVKSILQRAQLKSCGA